ncbi:hypothetical protein BDFB_005359 [Asbolus verrucosus]|uniref:Uncharacterized protein n=1 Tax=Asbolus verrucosus TaxID=1661398 RepID=A0A482VBF2_ASBVE|nr:hypothetical protein BDFB_005359 [Asbolus verrucosus]
MEIEEAARAVTLNLLPEKSRNLYENEYLCYRLVQIQEVYFTQKAKILNSAGLWSKYLVLKVTLAVKNNVDVNTSEIEGVLEEAKVAHLESYVGHSFRRSSASLQVGSETVILQLKRMEDGKVAAPLKVM